MTPNKISKRTMHSAMKPEALGNLKGRKRTLCLALGGILVVALAVGLYFGYATLRDLYKEQFVLRDLEAQVTVNVPKAREHLGETRPPLPAETLVNLFGLKPGIILTDVEFAKLRENILREQHTIRDIHVRLQPSSRPVRSEDGLARHENLMHVTISAEERDPLAILSHPGARGPMTVVDREGITFEKKFDARLLPRIVESAETRTRPGQRLSGRGLAALRLIDYCQQTATGGDVCIRDVNVGSPDFLLAGLSNGQKVKFVWEGMDEQLPGSQKAMARQVRHLREALRTRLADSALDPGIVWNATLPNRIFADTKEPIQ